MKKTHFVKYFISKFFDGSKISFQSAFFDTISMTSIYASDYMFKPDELKHW